MGRAVSSLCPKCCVLLASCGGFACVAPLPMLFAGACSLAEFARAPPNSRLAVCSVRPVLLPCPVVAAAV
jgi:hypothetical protein